jgi:hypothetical protein
LDDTFHAHPKVVAAGNAAAGLWVRCATYSAHYLTDGRIPADVAASMGKPREIGAVSAASLWVPNGDGFVIPDYLEYNPSAGQVLAERSAARLRVARRRRNGQGEFG